jgi:short-subunit dehydrogenase
MGSKRMRLEGKRAVVTGGSGGIGAPLVTLLRAEGADVTVIGRQAPAGIATGHVPADLATPGGLTKAAGAVAEIMPHMLVCLAGAQYFGPFADQPAQDISAAYQVNLVAPAQLARAALPGMLKRGTGHVLFAGSVFGALPFAHFAAYSSAKAGLAALALALRREYDGSGLTFTCAVPRAVKTSMASDAIRRFAAVAGFRFDAPEDVARRIADVLLRGSGDVTPGFPESLLMRLNAVSPALASRAIAGSDRKARLLLSQTMRSSHQ